MKYYIKINILIKQNIPLDKIQNIYLINKIIVLPNVNIKSQES